MDQVIAIDGPSGVGKSSVSKELAAKLGWTYLDTGAMYRTVTLAWLEAGLDEALLQQQRWLDTLDLDFQESLIFLNKRDVSDRIRAADVTSNVSTVAAVPLVRQHLTTMQRTIAGRRPCILDGRDIGTVVFPQAMLKIFLTASEQARARRRWLQLGGEESGTTVTAILQDQQERDRKDSNRTTAPLRQAEDALAIDTDPMDRGQVTELIYREALSRLKP